MSLTNQDYKKKIRISARNKNKNKFYLKNENECDLEWSNTELKDANTTPLLARDVKQLLITRGEERKNLKGKKSEMIEYLKEKYTVQLNEEFEELTCKEIIVELRLRGLNDTPAKKCILIARLKGLRNETLEPPKKKQRRGKKAKLDGIVYVIVYTPSADACDTSTQVLGVFESEAKAYNKSVEKLTEDIEEKYGDKKKQIEKVFEQIDKIDTKKYKKRYEIVSDALEKAFEIVDDAPYCDIIQSKTSF
eukprot:364910_1